MVYLGITKDFDRVPHNHLSSKVFLLGSPARWSLGRSLNLRAHPKCSTSANTYNSPISIIYFGYLATMQTIPLQIRWSGHSHQLFYASVTKKRPTYLKPVGVLAVCYHLVYS